jgi:outer membrane lipase/esterase
MYGVDYAGSINVQAAATEEHNNVYSIDVMRWLQMRPVGGLVYARSRVGAYTETGDPLLTFVVGDQLLDSLVGSVGVQSRFPLVTGGRVMSPYLNITAEHDFLDGSRTILATETQSPLLPILTLISNQG